MLHLSLILVPIIKDAVFQESCSKIYVFMSLGSNNFKIILALLRKVVAFYMQVTIVQIGVPGL